ncbi:MAG: PilZ domain-containing protein [Actinomycetia bacterium]|nr:PilZ domain-containing protein [Actinomycetes bacterium]
MQTTSQWAAAAGQSFARVPPTVVRLRRVGDSGPPMHLFVTEVSRDAFLIRMDAAPDWLTAGQRLSVEVSPRGSGQAGSRVLGAQLFETEVLGCEKEGGVFRVAFAMPSERTRAIDKRRAARATVDKEATTSTLDDGLHPQGTPVHTHVSNLSATGMLLESSVPLNRGAHVITTLDVADHTVNVIGTVVGSNEAAPIPTASVRIDFDSLSDEALVAIAVEVANLTGSESPYDSSPQLKGLNIPRQVRDAYARGQRCSRSPHPSRKGNTWVG